MRIVMMGTGPFAVPTFRALTESGHHVAVLVTRPSRPVRGRGKPPANPMRDEAEARGVAVFDPPSVNTDEARAELAALKPELLVVCDYGEILKPATLATATRGGINLHASLLPKYRGAAPVQWAVFHGETETGVTVIHMTPRLDAGPSIVQRRTAIEPDETADLLEARLATIGAEAVLEAIELIAADRAQPIVQDGSLATKAPRLKKSDGQVDWSRTAVQIANQVRALKPWPTTYTFWHRAGHPPLRLLLDQVAAREGDSKQPPGTIVDNPDRLLVATGAGLLELLEIQPAGKRPLSTAQFLRGYPLTAGGQLGP